MELASSHSIYCRSSSRGSSSNSISRSSSHWKDSFSREVFPGGVPPCPLVGGPLGALEGTPTLPPTSQSSTSMLVSGCGYCASYYWKAACHICHPIFLEVICKNLKYTFNRLMAQIQSLDTYRIRSHDVDSFP